MWLVVDGVKPPDGTLVVTRNLRLRIVMVSSSNLSTQKWLREWDKDVHFRLLATPFSWEETLLAARLRTPLAEFEVEKERVEKRFAVFGGVPRLVLARHPDPNSWLEAMVPSSNRRKVLLETLMDTVEGVHTQGPNKSRLIHLYPVADPTNARLACNYDFKVARFASRMVQS